MIRSVKIGPFDLYADDASDAEGASKDITGLKILENGLNFEKHVWDELAKIIPSSIGFLDIGANVGLYTVGAKSINPDLPVVAVEVSHHNCHLLMRTLVENKIGGVTVLNVPLSDKKGIVKVDSNRINTVVNQGCGSWPVDTKWEYRYAFPLDFFPIPECDLIKMDIDGSEYLALLGMTNIMARQPRVIFEYCPLVTVRSGLKKPIELLQYFINQGYKLTVLDFIPGIRKTFTDAEACHDYVVSTTKWIGDILAEPL